MSKRIVIIGAGGFAREVLDVCDACSQDKQAYEVLGFIVDQQYGSPGTLLNDKPILGNYDWLERHSSQVLVTCAVGAPHLRYGLVHRAQKLGCQFFNLIHPTAILTRWVTLGEGVIITAGCILTNQIRIGNHVHINLDCTIGHDVVLEDFVTMSPGAHISGNVNIRPGCYVGTGANVIEKLELGEWSVVGAGSTIVKDVSPNTTVVGVPGKAIRSREPGWHLESNED
jgi:sugar O-acyltransferase (sialic acid O-acetyltransferase NeuD family)